MTVTVDDFLEHAGVKGMKWGQRKAKVTTADIKGARARQNEKLAKIQLRPDGYKTEAGLMKGLDAMARQQSKVLSHPDAKTAALMTKGEKAVRNTQIAALVVVGAGIAARAIAKG